MWHYSQIHCDNTGKDEGNSLCVYIVNNDISSRNSNKILAVLHQQLQEAWNNVQGHTVY